MKLKIVSPDQMEHYGGTGWCRDDLTLVFDIESTELEAVDSSGIYLLQKSDLLQLIEILFDPNLKGWDREVQIGKYLDKQ